MHQFGVWGFFVFVFFCLYCFWLLKVCLVWYFVLFFFSLMQSIEYSGLAQRQKKTHHTVLQLLGKLNGKLTNLLFFIHELCKGQERQALHILQTEKEKKCVPLHFGLIFFYEELCSFSNEQVVIFLKACKLFCKYCSLQDIEHRYKRRTQAEM